MNKKVDEENVIGDTQDNGKFRKLRQFSRNDSGRTLGVLCHHLTLALGG